MKNKKGFTMVELLAVIVILGILAALGITAVSSYLKQGYKATYVDFEKTLKSATENALVSYSSLVPNVGSSKIVDAKWLLCHDYIKHLRDPKNEERNCEDKSYVIVTRTTDVGFNMDVNYEVCLQCGNYQSEACKKNIDDNISRLSVDENCEDIIR